MLRTVQPQQPSVMVAHKPYVADAFVYNEQNGGNEPRPLYRRTLAPKQTHEDKLDWDPTPDQYYDRLPRGLKHASQPVWRREIDGQTGYPFWVNDKLKQITWDDPGTSFEEAKDEPGHKYSVCRR